MLLFSVLVVLVSAAEDDFPSRIRRRIEQGQRFLSPSGHWRNPPEIGGRTRELRVMMDADVAEDYPTLMNDRLQADGLPVLAVLGNTRKGKSMFVGTSGGNNRLVRLGHDEHSVTSETTAYEMLWRGDGQPFVALDTPGRNDSRDAGHIAQGDVGRDALNLRDLQAQFSQVQISYGGVNHFVIVMKVDPEDYSVIDIVSQMRYIKDIIDMIKGDEPAQQRERIDGFLRHISFALTKWKRRHSEEFLNAFEERRRREVQNTIRQQLQDTINGQVMYGAERTEVTPGAWEDVLGSGTRYQMTDEQRDAIPCMFVDNVYLEGRDPRLPWNAVEQHALVERRVVDGERAIYEAEWAGLWQRLITSDKFAVGDTRAIATSVEIQRDRERQAREAAQARREREAENELQAARNQQHMLVWSENIHRGQPWRNMRIHHQVFPNEAQLNERVAQFDADWEVPKWTCAAGPYVSCGKISYTDGTSYWRWKFPGTSLGGRTSGWQFEGDNQEVKDLLFKKYATVGDAWQ